MKILAIYDNGGETLDRYTVVTDWKDGDKYLMMLGLSEGGNGVSQWGGGQYDHTKTNEHLGKRVHFEDLSAETQEHIASRVFAGEE